MTLIDEEDRKQRWLGVAAFALFMLAVAFAWGAWVERSDAQAVRAFQADQCGAFEIAELRSGGVMECQPIPGRKLSAEQCKPGEVAFVRADGTQTLCLRGSQRAGGARR